MTDAKAIRRKILTYALVSQNFAGRRDPITALFPLFAPIAVDLAGQRFDAARFQTEMRVRYAMDLSRDVVDLFVQRLGQLGLIVGGNLKATWSATPVAAHNAVADDGGMTDRLVTKAQAFHAENQDLITTPFDEEAFLGGLMRVVLDSQQVLKVAVAAISSSESDQPVLQRPSDGARVRDSDEYFASRFIAWTKTKDPELFGWIAELGGAAIVAEALVELRNPTLPKSVSPDLTLYLDTPFLMELLGCSGKASREDAKYIYEQLRIHRINVSVFSHLIDELRYNLKGVLKQPAEKRTGPSAVALLFQEVTEKYLADVLDDPEYYIKELGLGIVKMDSQGTLSDSDHFSDDDQHSYFSTIQSYYNHPEAAQRDADSVSWIMRRRRGEQSRDILKAKHALLTRNQLVYRQINRFCLDKGYVKHDRAGPVVLARDLAGVLWLLAGSAARSEISQRQLLLNCQRARANAPKVVASMVDTLREVSGESADLFMVAVNKPSYLSLALDTVAGSGSGVTKEIAENTLEKIRDDLVAEERAKAKIQLKNAKDHHEQDSNLKEIVIDSLREEREALFDLQKVDEEHWIRLAKTRWIETSASARNSWLAGTVFANIVVFLIACAGVYVGTDLFPGPEWAKFSTGALVVLVLTIISTVLSRDPIRRFSEQSKQRLYTRWVSENVPDHHLSRSRIDQEMISGSFFDIAFRKLNKSTKRD